MSAFALEKAKEMNIKMKKSDIFNDEYGNEIMFYFTKVESDKSVNFIIFDNALRSI